MEMLEDFGMVMCLICFAAAILMTMKMAAEEGERTKWPGDDK